MNHLEAYLRVQKIEDELKSIEAKLLSVRQERAEFINSLPYPVEDLEMIIKKKERALSDALRESEREVTDFKAKVQEFGDVGW